MKPRVLLPAVAILALLVGRDAHAGDTGDPPFSFRDLDKQTHIAVSYALTFTGAVIARHYNVPRWQAVAIAAAATLVLATAKELVHDDVFSWGDMLANTIGTSTATIVVLSVRL